MRLLDRLHEGAVYPRRVRVLGERIADLLPREAGVLDVGCGDGSVARALLARRPDVRVEGIDVLVRPDAAIPVMHFDGRTIPHEDGSFDAAVVVDVLHHADDPDALLRETVRVARRCVVVKDHLTDGFLAEPTLRFMDSVGNRRHGVALPYG